jgi:hypothetical protein
MSPEKKIKKQKQKQRKKIFRKWHRRMGFAASLFLFNLAITGILLNHYEGLSLHKKYLENELLLDWYNVKAPKNINCATASDLSVCQLGSYIYLDSPTHKNTQLLNNENLISFVKLDSEYFLVTQKSLFIYTENFDLIESVDAIELFSTPITKANIIDQTLVVQAADSEFFYHQDSFEFQPILKSDRINNSPLVSSIFELKDPSIIESLSLNYRQHQISLLKLVQDLHSGQILSLQGKLLTDITGIIIMLLAISGFITWQRRKNNP